MDAFFEVRRARRAVLVLVGDGPERAAMEARAQGRDDVVFLGFDKDRARLAATLASADALVHGCPYETFGLSIAEAMACGLPVVVPDEGGAAEMVDGASGESYPSLDAAACARAITRLLGRDRDALRRGALDASSRVPDVTKSFARLFDSQARCSARAAGRRARANGSADGRSPVDSRRVAGVGARGRSRSTRARGTPSRRCSSFRTSTATGRSRSIRRSARSSARCRRAGTRCSSTASSIARASARGRAVTGGRAGCGGTSRRRSSQPARRSSGTCRRTRRASVSNAASAR